MQWESKTRWDAENATIAYSVITKGADPELFELLSNAESKSGTARELMQLALDRRMANGADSGKD